MEVAWDHKFTEPQWSRIGRGLVADIASAAVSSILITPAVCAIDSIVMLKAASSCSFSSCVRKFFTPASNIPRALWLSLPSRLVFAVYFGTYATANAIDTYTSSSNPDHTNSVGSGSFKLLAVTAVSTGLTIYKDSRLARILGTRSQSSAIPLSSYTLFAARDAITIYGSFILPAIVVSSLPPMFESQANQMRVAQLALPALTQFVTTPVHLLGLDIYNRPGQLGLPPRLGRIRRDMGVAVPIRTLRIIPAFGIGNIVNSATRDKLVDLLDAREDTAQERLE